ncbi:MAG TPA: hypothetical protein VF403_26405 [Kofleriaceae bacterium]
MQALRGVMADAECPRCGATSPPPESLLATCARCGLVFPPHEVLHKSSAPPDDSLIGIELPDPPPDVTVHREGAAIAIVWPLARYVTAFAFSAGLFLAYLAASRTPATLTRPFWIGVAVCAAFGVIQLFAHHVITIGPDAVEHHISFTIGTRTVLPFDRAVRVEIRKERRAMYELHLISSQRLARTLLVRSIDRSPLGYAADLITARLITARMTADSQG